MPNVQYFDRDDDDWRFVTLFTYVTDVGDGEGPHQIIPYSHTLPRYAGDGASLLVGTPCSNYDVERTVYKIDRWLSFRQK